MLYKCSCSCCFWNYFKISMTFFSSFLKFRFYQKPLKCLLTSLFFCYDLILHSLTLSHHGENKKKFFELIIFVSLFDTLTEICWRSVSTCVCNFIKLLFFVCLLPIDVIVFCNSLWNKKSLGWVVVLNRSMIVTEHKQRKQHKQTKQQRQRQQRNSYKKWLNICMYIYIWMISVKQMMLCFHSLNGLVLSHYFCIQVLLPFPRGGYFFSTV